MTFANTRQNQPRNKVVATIDRDANRIGDIFSVAATDFVQGVQGLVECGKLLVAKKATMQHGEWIPWLKQNEEILGFRRRAAQAMMTQANTQLTAYLDTTQALALSRQIWGNNSHYKTTGAGVDDWHTPSKYIKAAREVLGEIDLDPATDKRAQRTVRAKTYLTEDDDSLAQEWHGRVWLNPPYSQPLIQHFIDKLVAELIEHKVTQAILLTHNSTDTAWFHKAEEIAGRLCFTRGRISFIYNGEPQDAAAQGQTFFYYGNRVNKFAEVFSSYGFIR